MARVETVAASETERVIKRKADSSAVARINEHRRPGNGGVGDCPAKTKPRPFSSQGRAPQLNWKILFSSLLLSMFDARFVFARI